MSWKDCEYEGSKQGPDHPVVNVSWEDAQAFEWCLAVGKGKYPWGTQWPPPKGMGNYSGQESEWTSKIEGYKDATPGWSGDRNPKAQFTVEENGPGSQFSVSSTTFT